MNTIHAEAHLHGTQIHAALGASSVRRRLAQWLQSAATWLHQRARQRLSIREHRRLRVQNSGASWAACFEFDPRTDDMLHRGDD